MLVGEAEVLAISPLEDDPLPKAGVNPVEVVCLEPISPWPQRSSGVRTP